ncbi:MAG TPA: phosphoribosylamine--glycine ligase [Chitinophagales bacterium]|nr:phosphoribosylamine--glycine ligase [Chitinophagales bacterium]
MKIAIIGSGAREHALYWKLTQNRPENEVVVLPGNAGIENYLPIREIDFNSLRRFMQSLKTEIIIPGSENILAKGATDYFSAFGLKVFGPPLKSVKMESSKIWAKNFMKKYQIPTAPFWVFGPNDNPDTIIKQLNGNLVIKYDGLASGKGVFVCSSVAEAQADLAKLKAKYGAKTNYLIEERLQGPEISIIAITDHKTILPLPPVTDYKRLQNNDQGPNTGGMGTVCPTPLGTPAQLKTIVQQIINPTLKGMQSEGITYTGFLYFGIMLTAEGPQLLEYNVRMGDPEAQVIMPALKNDLNTLIEASLNNTLSKHKIETNKGSFVNIVLAGENSPAEPSKNIPIYGFEKATIEGKSFVLHAATKRNKENEIVTNGGRILSVVGQGKNLPDALKNAYQAANQIQFKGMQFRTDIAQNLLKL